MKNITIADGIATIEYTDSDPISAQFEDIERVDDNSFHLYTEIGASLFYVSETTINGNTFTNSTEAVEFVENL